MAVATPTNNIWRYQLNLSRAGQKAIIGIVLRNLGTPANTDYFNFCNSILVAQEAVGKIWSVTKEMLGEDWAIDSHQLQAISPTRLVPLIRQPGGTPTQGIRAGAMLPINTQVAIARKSAVATRYGQSILKPPFGTSGDTPDWCSWSNAGRADFKTWGDLSVSNFVGTTAGDVLQPVIWSSGPPADALEFRTVVVNPYLRVIRRRTVGLGI